MLKGALGANSHLPSQSGLCTGGHLLCAGGLSHLTGEKDIPQHLLVSLQGLSPDLLAQCHKLCSQQDSRLALDAASPPWLQFGLPDQKLRPWHRLDQSREQASFQLSIFLGKEENTHNAKGAYTQAIYLRTLSRINSVTAVTLL